MITPPTTELEKTACEVAKQEAITNAINEKKQAYQRAMGSYLSVINNIKTYQNQIDTWQKQAIELETNLGITAEQKVLLF